MLPLLPIIAVCVSYAAAQTLTNPIIWNAVKVYNASMVGQEIRGTARIAMSQFFQTIYPGQDDQFLIRKTLFDFSVSCPSNTTSQQLQTLNQNLLYPGIRDFKKAALIERGGCNWSEKVQYAQTLAEANNMTLSTIYIYDNQSYGVDYTIGNPQGLFVPPNNDTAIPDARNIAFMADNDIGAANLSVSAYFITRDYAQYLFGIISNATLPSNDTNVSFVEVVNYLKTPNDYQVPTDGSGQETSPSRSYLSYVIAIAAIFLISLFGGIVFLRYWKRRQMRLNPIQNGDAMYQMQLRAQAKPLPVDIVKSLPIQKYSSETIKNNSCAICLDDFTENETEVRVLPCMHGFCVPCIDPWLLRKSTNCPVCKWDCLPPERRQELENESNGSTSTTASPSPDGQPSTSDAQAHTVIVVTPAETEQQHDSAEQRHDSAPRSKSPSDGVQETPNVSQESKTPEPPLQPSSPALNPVSEASGSASQSNTVDTNPQDHLEPTAEQVTTHSDDKAAPETSSTKPQ